MNALLLVVLLGSAPAPVVDRADVLPVSEEMALSSRLRAFEQADRVEFVIATLDRVPPGTTADAEAMRLASLWSLGDRAGGRGVLMAFFRDDMAFALHVSGDVPNLTAAEKHRVVNAHMAPYFRSGGAAKGFEAGAREIMDTIRGNRTPYRGTRTGSRSGGPGRVAGGAGIVVLGVLSIVVRFALFGSAGFGYGYRRRGMFGRRSSLLGIFLGGRRGGFSGRGSDGFW